MQLRLLLLVYASVRALRPPTITAAASSGELARAAAALVREGDSVLEVGSQLGRVTEAAAAAAGAAGGIVALDVARKVPRVATARTAHFRGGGGGGGGGVGAAAAAVAFRELPRLGAWRGALRAEERFDAVILEAQALHGMDLPLDTIALCGALASRPQAGAPPRCVLVKSAALARLGGRLFAADDLGRADRVLAVAAERAARLDPGRLYEAEPLLVASHSRAVQLSLSGDVATGAGCTMRSRRSCAGSCPSCACRRSRLVSSPEAQSRQLRPRRVVLLPRPLSRAREAPQ